MAKRSREEQGKSRAREENVRRTRQDARIRKKMARLREGYAQMEKERGEALTAFTEHLAKERARAEHFAGNLSEVGRKKYLAAFESPEGRLEIFERWLERSGAIPSNWVLPESLAPPEGESDAAPDTSSVIQ
jgi:hypothetical protein